MFARKAIVWSSCETDYLKSHLDEPLLQLAGYLSKSVNAIKTKIKEIKTGIVPTKKRSSKGTKIGKRPDLGLFTRSGWEANVLRLLKHQNKIYEYEPDTYLYTEFGIKHGNVSYTPDIKVYENGSWYYIEIKGYLDAGDKAKLNRFKKFYPEEFKRLKVIVGSSTNKTAQFFTKIGVPIMYEYNKINKEYKDIIPNWE